MKASYQIYSQDAFLTIGISSLLDSILSRDILFKEKKINFLLISSVSLLSMVGFCHTLEPEQDYFVIGSTVAWSILNGSGVLRLKGFIDISKSITQIKYELYFILKGIEKVNFPRVFTDKIVLSPCERLVLRYITLGMSPSSIARCLGLSVKTISSQKRSMMKKLCVSSNQQLVIKAKMANYLH